MPARFTCYPAHLPWPQSGLHFLRARKTAAKRENSKFSKFQRDIDIEVVLLCNQLINENDLLRHETDVA